MSPTEAKLVAVGHPAQVGGEALVALQRLERALPLGDVALAPALRLEHAARAQSREQARRTAARGRGSSGRWRWRRSRRPARSSSSVEQVGDAQLDPVAELGQVLAGVLDHRRRGVDADHPALGQALAEQPRHPAAAAAGVEHGLVAAQVEPGEHLAPPLLLRVGDLVVGRARPSRPGRSPAHSAVVTGPRSARAGGLEGVDRVGVLQRDPDVVEAVEEAVLDLLVDLEPDDAGRPSRPSGRRGRSAPRRPRRPRGSRPRRGSPAAARSWCSCRRRCRRTTAR